MGKSASKVIEVMRGQPTRYVVTNTEKLILVTHDRKFAEKIAQAISELENPKKFFIRL